MAQEQVKSKQRVVKYAEVFTAEREVNAMLDLVKQETERIDSRFLEPACGDGNFLAEILRRKLAVVKKKYRKSPADYEMHAVEAVTSIYGVEILEDNAEACRERLFEIWNKEYTANCKKDATDQCREAVRFILCRNILCGDPLNMKTADGGPVVFSEWSFGPGSKVKRRDFRLDKLLEGDPEPKQIFIEALQEQHPLVDGRSAEQLSLFGNNADEWEYDEKEGTYYRNRKFPLTDYWSVQDYE